MGVVCRHSPHNLEIKAISWLLIYVQPKPPVGLHELSFRADRHPGDLVAACCVELTDFSVL